MASNEATLPADYDQREDKPDYAKSYPGGEDASSVDSDTDVSEASAPDHEQWDVGTGDTIDGFRTKKSTEENDITADQHFDVYTAVGVNHWDTKPLGDFPTDGDDGFQHKISVYFLAGGFSSVLPEDKNDDVLETEGIPILTDGVTSVDAICHNYGDEWSDTNMRISEVEKLDAVSLDQSTATTFMGERGDITNSLDALDDYGDATNLYSGYVDNENPDYPGASAASSLAALGAFASIATGGAAAVTAGTITGFGAGIFEAGMGAIGIIDMMNRTTIGSVRDANPNNTPDCYYTEHSVTSSETLTAGSFTLNIATPAADNVGLDLYIDLPIAQEYSHGPDDDDYTHDIDIRREYNLTIGFPVNEGDDTGEEANSGWVTTHKSNCPDHTSSPSAAKEKVLDNNSNVERNENL